MAWNSLPVVLSVTAKLSQVLVFSDQELRFFSFCKKQNVYFILGAVLSLCFGTQALSLVAVLGLLLAVASLAVEHRL